MTGQHIQKLLTATASSDHEKLLDSRKAWRTGFDALNTLFKTLDTAAVEVERGFADGVATDEQGTAARGRKAFETLRDDVVGPRRDQMEAAAAVLLTAAQKLNSAELARADMPDSPPGEAPQRPSPYGIDDEIDAIRVQRAYDNQVNAHNAAVTAYGDADEKARRKLEALDTAYVEASRVLAEIHGEPVYPEDLPPPGEPGPGGFPVGPGGQGRPNGAVGVHHPVPTVQVPGFVPGENTGPEQVTPGPVGGTLTNPGPTGPIGGPSTGTGSTGGGGLGINPAVGGGLAAGVFGGPGLVKAVRGALAGRGAFGPSPGTIGSTSRAGGAGTLGRSGGGATPGSPVSRSGGRAGASGGAGGGRPGPGTAGGRGRGGGSGRGVPGTSPSGRGRQGRDEKGRERDLFDDGSDWIDDEGAGPDVLG